MTDPRANLDRGVAHFALDPCRFCHRIDPINAGLYTRVFFPDGISNVCDDCLEKADDAEAEFVEWRGTQVEVID